MNDEDAINHPSHYTSHPSGIETIEIARHFSYNIGTVIAYLWRAGKKKESTLLQDLKKAAWHLNDEIKKAENAEHELKRKWLNQVLSERAKVSAKGEVWHNTSNETSAPADGTKTDPKPKRSYKRRAKKPVRGVKRKKP